jgi:hypothetical protein
MSFVTPCRGRGISPNRNFRLRRRANQWLIRRWITRDASMSERSPSPSDVIEVSKLNGDFRKNYGTVLGAFLYLRSISAARGKSLFWTGLASAICSVVAAWLTKHGLVW